MPRFRWMNMVPLALLLGCATACGSPTGPRMPEEEDHEPDTGPDDDQSMVREIAARIFFV